MFSLLIPLHALTRLGLRAAQPLRGSAGNSAGAPGQQPRPDRALGSRRLLGRRTGTADGAQGLPVCLTSRVAVGLSPPPPADPEPTHCGAWREGATVA